MVRLSLPLASVGVLCMFVLLFYLSGADVDTGAHVLAPSLLSYRHTSSSSSPLSTQRDALRLATDDVDESLLSFSHIYVINLAHRKDRRMHMTRLARALGVEMTFVDAITTKHPVVSFILDRLLEDQLRAEREGGPERLADLEPTREWPGGRTWREFALLALSDNPPEYPPPEASRSSEQQQQVKLDYPAQHWGETAKIEDHWGPTACYLSHLKAWGLSAANNDSTALFLEDDVDVEFDLMMIWRSLSRALYRHRRNAWHFVFLGWSWSAEQYHKPTFHPLLRKASSPSGLHAYVMSQMGIERARSSLMALETLFQRPIDQDIPKGLIPSPGFEFFSVVPPIVVAGTMSLGTDIGGIGGTLWGGLLGDSTFSRVRAAEAAAAVAAGEPAPPLAHALTEEEVSLMLAVKAGF